MEGFFNFLNAYAYDFTAVIISIAIVAWRLADRDFSVKDKFVIGPCCMILGATKVFQDAFGWLFAMFPPFSAYVLAAVILYIIWRRKKADNVAGISFMIACGVLGTSPLIVSTLPPLVNGLMSMATAVFGSGYGA